MDDRAKKEELLRGEIARCILLEEEDKAFWLEQAGSLPDEVLAGVIDAVRGQNARVEEYIDAALAEDKDHKYLAELKEKIKKVKFAAFAMDEKGEKTGAAKTLEKELGNL